MFTHSGKHLDDAVDNSFDFIKNVALAGVRPKDTVEAKCAAVLFPFVVLTLDGDGTLICENTGRIAGLVLVRRPHTD